MKPLFLNKFMSGRRPRMNLWKNKGFMTGLTNLWLRKWIENKNFLNFSTIYEMLIALKFSKRFFCPVCLCNRVARWISINSILSAYKFWLFWKLFDYFIITILITMSQHHNKFSRMSYATTRGWLYFPFDFQRKWSFK